MRAIFKGQGHKVDAARESGRNDGHLPDKDSGDDYRYVMLVLIRKSVKDVERMPRRVISSVVRLEVSNQVYDIRRKAFLEPRETLTKELRLAVKHSKTESAGRGLAVDLPETPYKVVEHRPQLMGDISDEHSKPQGGTAEDFHSVTVHHHFRNLLPWLFLGNYTVCTGFKELIDFDSELIDVFPCPIDSKAGKFYIIGSDGHGQTLPNADPKDAPKTLARGVNPPDSAGRV